MKKLTYFIIASASWIWAVDKVVIQEPIKDMPTFLACAVIAVFGALGVKKGFDYFN